MKLRLSKHITLDEAVHSDTAKRLDIPNVPDNVQINNMVALALMVFEPLRIWVGGPIKISSMFRSEELNRMIGGSDTSSHLCLDSRAAMDLDDVYGHKTNLEMFNWIKDNLEFDQLLNERPDSNGNPSWIHVSYDIYNNRNEVFTI